MIVHELEYAWYVEEATRNANPGGEADVFLAYLDKNKASIELDSIGNTEEIETLLTSEHNAEINSPDDAINIINKLLPLMGDEDEIGDIHNVLGDFFNNMHEMQKDICDDADTK